MIELEYPDIRNANRTGYAIGAEPRYIGTCFCGDGIAEGEEYYAVDGKMYHKECFHSWADDVFSLLTAREKAKMLGAEVSND